MKKIMFSVVSVITALLISVVMISCGGGGGGGGSSSGSGSAGQGQPSGTTVYDSTTYAFPTGFYTAENTNFPGALWINENNTNSALWILDATHAYQLNRTGPAVFQTEIAYDVEITSGANGYVRFDNPNMNAAQYAYNLTNTELVISNTYHGTKRYMKFDSNTPITIY